MALNKKISIYGSISYFSKKTENEIFKIVSPEELLKFYVDKDAAKHSFSFQLTNISGDIPKLNTVKCITFPWQEQEKIKKENDGTNRNSNHPHAAKL